MPELTEDIVTRCVVRRGAFVVPGALFDDGRELELARYIAQRLPDGRRASTTWGKPDATGAGRIRWRVVDVVRVR